MKRRKHIRSLIPSWFWHPYHVEDVRKRIEEDLEKDPKMCIPAFRKSTRHITRILPDDDTLPNIDPQRTDKMDFAMITTARVGAI